MAHVIEAVTNLALGAWHLTHGTQLAGAHQEKSDDDGAKRYGVDTEAPCISHTGHQHTAQRLSHHAAAVEDGAVQPHRVGEILGTHHFGYKGLTGGHVERVANTHHERQRAKDDEVDMPAYHQPCLYGGRDTHQ